MISSCFSIFIILNGFCMLFVIFGHGSTEILVGSISIVVGVHAVPWVDFHLRGNLGELTRSVLQNQGIHGM